MKGTKLNRYMNILKIFFDHSVSVSLYLLLKVCRTKVHFWYSYRKCCFDLLKDYNLVEAHAANGEACDL